ncbi:MAG: TIGR04076 family protein [Caldilinea sp.]
MNDDEFELYDLVIVVETIEGNCTCSMTVGDCFYLRGGKLSLPAGHDFCVYALQATLPLLPAKQRRNHRADWMETDARVTCPDPACRLIMRIERIGQRTLKHDDVSPIAWEELSQRTPPSGD